MVLFCSYAMTTVTTITIRHDWNDDHHHQETQDQHRDAAVHTEEDI